MSNDLSDIYSEASGLTQDVEKTVHLLNKMPRELLSFIDFCKNLSSHNPYFELHYNFESNFCDDASDNTITMVQMPMIDFTYYHTGGEPPALFTLEATPTIEEGEEFIDGYSISEYTDTHPDEGEEPNEETFIDSKSGNNLEIGNAIITRLVYWLAEVTKDQDLDTKQRIARAIKEYSEEKNIGTDHYTMQRKQEANPAQSVYADPADNVIAIGSQTALKPR